MKTSVAVQSFGSTRKLAEALGLSVQAIYKWGDDVPALREYQIRDLIAARAQEANTTAHLPADHCSSCVCEQKAA